MNEDIRKRHLEEGRSPFKFNFIRHVTKTSDPIFQNRPAGSPCVAIASPGMLQSGISLELFERCVVVVLRNFNFDFIRNLTLVCRWCSNEKNAVVLAGYACQNTTAHELQGNKQTHKKEDGREIPVKSVLLSSPLSFERFSYKCHELAW
jgi:cleavage and polyadenylation specificity factor subunit 3